MQYLEYICIGLSLVAYVGGVSQHMNMIDSQPDRAWVIHVLNGTVSYTDFVRRSATEYLCTIVV